MRSAVVKGVWMSIWLGARSIFEDLLGRGEVYLY